MSGFVRVLAGLAAMLIGRRNLYRVGRWSYMAARNDGLNRIEMNGEEWVQSCVLGACHRAGGSIVVFDIGANVGDWIWSLLSVAGRLNCRNQLEVHAFEPVPSTYERLLANVKNDLRSASISVECSAMSSSIGSGTMFIVGDGAGTNSLHPDTAVLYERSLVVATTTIDHYLREHNIGAVQLLKSDTEGHDMDVLRGARESLKHERIRVFQFEYNHRWVYSRNFLRDVFEFIRGLPYFLGKLTPGVIEFYQEWHPELERFFEGNYVLVHRDARQWFPHRLMKFDSSNVVQQA